MLNRLRYVDEVEAHGEPETVAERIRSDTIVEERVVLDNEPISSNSKKDEQHDTQTTQQNLREADCDLEYLSKQADGPSAFTKTCQVCSERLSMFEFPASAPTASCSHSANTCSYCLRRWIMHVLGDRGRAAATCPECRMPLSQDDIRRGVFLRF
jgi:hypothetical protein